MRIFVGYGFNDRDQWVKEFVFPIIEAFGDEVVTGEELHGELITEAVKNKIIQSDALIGFATRRQRISNSQEWETHRWVTDEISQAIAHNLPIVEVREHDVNRQDGIITGRQLIRYDENKRDECLVELVKAIGKWHREGVGNYVEFLLLPEAFVSEVRPWLSRNEGFSCTYKLREGNRKSNSIDAEIDRMQGGLYAVIKPFPTQGFSRKAFIDIRVAAGGHSWSSGFQSIDSYHINLERE